MTSLQSIRSVMPAMILLAAGCGAPAVAPPVWQPMMSNLSGALLSVWGTSNSDVYVVGADTRDGLGPTALHFDGQRWTRLNTGLDQGDLWWVYGIGDAVFMTGSNGVILRYDPHANTFVRTPTPGMGTIFGLWGATADDIWAAGRLDGMAGQTDIAGLVWHFDGTQWTNVAMPNGVEMHERLFKVWGRNAHDVWIVGTNATTLHYDGAAWAQVPVGDDLGGKLITVHGNGDRRFAVGGTGSAVILESNGSGGWRRVDTTGMAALNGLYVPATGNPVAVGISGSVMHLDRQNHWHTVAPGPSTDYDFHSLWIAPTGEVWAVGGDLVSDHPSNGMLWRFGGRIADAPTVLDPSLTVCPEGHGTICTWAGSSVVGFDGDGHSLTESALYWPVDLEFSPTDQPFIVDWNNHRIRAVEANGTLRTVVGSEFPGDGDPATADLVAPGVPGTIDAMNHPTDLLFQPDGQLLISVWHNHKIRRWDPSTGNSMVVAGRAAGFAGDNGPFASAILNKPSHITYGPSGELYILDQENHRIRRVGTDGAITTFAGTGAFGFAGDGGPATSAQFSWQYGESPEPNGGLVVDPSGRLFVADTGNHRIRAIDIATGIISTYAGTGTAGYAGDGGPAAAAQFDNPTDIEIGPEGDLYVTDTYSHCIRAIDHTTTVIRTVAGRCLVQGFGGDRGPATSATFYRPFGIAFDHAGNLYVADTRNSRVRRVQR